MVIEGENLLGNGHGVIRFSRVVVGTNEAELDLTQSNSTHIYSRISSGDAGSTRIIVNTTQTIESEDYDGPYTFSDSLWTQLEDGVITEIIPPAVQAGGTLRMCGERLLGGGSSVASITIAEQSVNAFGNVEPNPDSSSPPECIEASVPDVADPGSVVTGGVVIEADTGAIVESTVEFTYAVITDVDPNRGQLGTEVAISGIGLLSGYTDLEPAVYLSGIEATVISASSDSIVVRVEDPTNESASFEGSGEPPLSDIYNVTGDIEIVVTRDEPEFTLTLADGWTYLEAGVIQVVQPEFGQVGTRITLTGENLLGYGSGLGEARIGGLAANIVSDNDTLVVLDAPDIQGTGQVSIVLESVNGALVRLDDAFEYRERGVISNLDPPSGQNGTFGKPHFSTL